MKVCLFGKKKIMPMWFILDAPVYGKTPSRQGPYSHETFVRLLAEKRIETTQLIWTNEKIFPNPSKPKSSRLIRLHQWLRIDQFPDPTISKLQFEAQQLIINNNQMKSISLTTIPGTPAPEGMPPTPRGDDNQQQQQLQQQNQNQQHNDDTDKTFYDPTQPQPIQK